MANGREGRPPTLTERARRAQLIEVAIEQVAEHGYAGTSLSRIADGAGITKAAVLYHFSSKDAVILAAYEHVLAALVETVGAAVDAAGDAGKPAAYARAMIGHLRARPRHTRMLIEAVTGTAAERAPEARWRPLAGLLDGAVRARGGAGIDSRTAALAIGGAIDAIVAERLRDPGYDTAAAAEVLAAMIDTWITR
ncbi:TetR/AcrR family transcriptional regulator [Nocardia jiangsuensis]|uniref:TetR/AcrR family transcriptional regulator n=1 Tax=Nocardia jiangsuensis TaxID=1691563 RepID=A0ABV8DYK1_9NOCA